MNGLRIRVGALIAVSFGLITATHSIAQEISEDTDRSVQTQRVSEKQLSAAGDLMLDGKYSDAADIYKHILSTNPNSADALAGYGLALARQFKLDAADEQFEKLLSQDPKNPVAHCGKAMVILNRLQSSSNSIIKNRSSMLKEAGRECNKALDSDPRVVEAHYLLGRVFKEENRLELAEQAFQGAIKLDPRYANAYAQLGLVQVLLNKLTDATQNLKKAISINSGNSTAHFGMGQVLLKQNDVDGAIAELTISLYQNRNSAPVHSLLGKAYELQGNLVAATREYKEAIKIKPEIPTPYLDIATIEENRGDLEMAIADLRSGLMIIPDDPSLLLRIATNDLRLEKFDDAIKNFEQAASASPKDSVAVEGLSRALYLKAQKETAGAFIASSDYEQASILLDRSEKLNPGNIQIKLAAAKLRMLSGEPVDLSKIPPPKNDAERPGYAEALLAQGKYAEASEQMKAAINACSNATQLFATADLAFLIKDLPDAELAYNRAASYPDSAERAKRGLVQIARTREEARQNTTLGQDLARKHQWASAIDKFTAAAYQNPFDSNVHLYLAQALDRNSDQPSAMRAAVWQYRAYLKLAPNLPSHDLEHVQKRIAKLESRSGRSVQTAQTGTTSRVSAK